MERIFRKMAAPALTVGLILGAAGCHKQSDQQVPDQTQDQGTDPAAANMAPVDSNDAGAASSSVPAQTSSTPRQAAQPSYSTDTESTPPPPPDESASSASYPESNPYPADNTVPDSEISPDQSGYYDESAYAQPVYASEAPPPIPEYVQPPCPGPNYIWTPGYWAWSPAGYYWVPGTWVLAPYTGALWTPGFWLFVSLGHFLWHPGYWGPHIGYYGGINYGNGYIGHGYYGGYWNRGNFFYNRAVTNVNTTIVRNVYVHNVTINNYNVTRVSYNGGPGGIQARPTPSEQIAMRERHLPPLRAQTQLVREAAQNRAQFFQANRGRPQMVALDHPLATPYHAPATQPPVRGVANPGFVRTQRVMSTPQFNRAEQQARPENMHRPESPQPAPVSQIHPEQQGRPNLIRPGVHPETGQIQAHPQPVQQRPEQMYRPQSPVNRPEAQPRPEVHPQQARPAEQQPRPQPAPQPRQEVRPQEQRPEQVRPQPQQRPEPMRPQPQHQEPMRPQEEHPHAQMQKPSPMRAENHPQAHGEDGHGR